MMILNKNLPVTVFLALAMSTFLSCCKTGKMSDQGSDSIPGKPNSSLPEAVLSVLSPSPSSRFTVGNVVGISWKMGDHAVPLDSVRLYIDGRQTSVFSAGDGSYHLVTAGMRPGRHTIRLSVSDSLGAGLSKTLQIFLLSDLVPELLSYRIIHSYPHDPGAYTQGLLFKGGFIYESTGQNGRSSLRKVNPETGELINSLSLAREYFGEGICFWEDKIIQLTWTSKVGFIYDLETFRLVNKIHYPTQGWGLTTDGEHLIMSDGSNILYFLEPELFTEVYRIEVFDNQGPVDQLNELEYINGKVYANVYQTDHIVIIDPGSGKVLSRADLTGLLDKTLHHPALDVLNGIAWDSEGDRLFVTGKMWPRLFEIKLVPAFR